MKVEEYLRFHTDVGDLVEFTDGGWRIGITYVDSEDLFLQSLNENLLNAEVKYKNESRRMYVGDIKNPTRIEIQRSIEIEWSK